jgi:acyl-[acyl carrier protein]--UDP-N-acetylglucosamine O-acyltransferase
MFIALKGHFFMQIPHPVHKLSIISTNLTFGFSSIVLSPVLTFGQYLIHGFSPNGLHLSGLQRSLLRTAILKTLSPLFKMKNDK